MDKSDKPLLSLNALSKSYQSVRAVTSVSLNVFEGEFVTLLGPSGCGKSTLLRLIAGFDVPNSGNILLDGKSILNVLPHKRPFGFVFQDLALFPHMTVSENIGFGLKVRHHNRQQIENAVAEVLDLVDLSGFGNRRIDEISGGQQQRVALARALVLKPRLLLLDEPLSALDQKIRVQLRSELKRIQRQLGVTFIFVTHDQNEAMSMSDRMVIINTGAVEQAGSPREIYDYPANRFVASFVGSMNFLKCEIDRTSDQGTIAHITALDKRVCVRSRDLAIENYDVDCYFCIRPECLSISSTPLPSSISGTVFDIEQTGATLSYSILSKNDIFLSVLTTGIVEGVEVGRDVYVNFADAKGVVMN